MTTPPSHFSAGLLRTLSFGLVSFGLVSFGPVSFGPVSFRAVEVTVR